MVPVLYAAFAEGVPTAQLLEGTLLAVAHSALGSHSLLLVGVTFLGRPKPWPAQDTFFKDLAGIYCMLVLAAAVVAPPKKPKSMPKTNQKPKSFFTIHTHPNHAFTLKLSDEDKTSVVGFRDWDDAFLIGKMIEAHFTAQKEWPETRQAGSLILRSSNPDDVLMHTYIQKWNFDELEMICTKNFLNFIGVENIVNRKNMGYAFDGNVYKFEADIDFYRERIGELWRLDTLIKDDE